MTDPYAPAWTAGPPPPSSRFPAGRLARVGATDKTLIVLQAWWDGLSPSERSQEASTLAVDTDAHLGEWVASIDDLLAASATSVSGWAERADNPRREAAIALVIEESRPRQRTNLVAKLHTMIKAPK